VIPVVTVVIPCFNQGRYLEETVDSVLQQTLSDLEIIVVNDGSNDEETNRILADFHKPKTRIIHTSNQGLAAARNNGISIARGKYILPLDADDRIGATYLEKATGLLDSSDELGIVYCRAQLFGASDALWDLPEYSLQEMLVDNVIFCSALFRRKDWEEVGGYDIGMIYGWEDYDFWLSLIEKGKQVHRLDEILFFYRVASDSMVRSKEKWQKIAMFKRIFKRHFRLYQDNIEVWLEKIISSREQYHTSRLYIDTGSGYSDENSVARKVDKGTRRIVFDLERFEQIKGLRFDPVDDFSVVEITQVVLLDDSGNSYELNDFSGNELYRQGNLLFFKTHDPQCHLDIALNQLNKIKQLIVNLTYLAFAEDALITIIDFQRERVRDNKGIIDLSGRMLSRLARKKW